MGSPTPEEEKNEQETGFVELIKQAKAKLHSLKPENNKKVPEAEPDPEGEKPKEPKLKSGPEKKQEKPELDPEPEGEKPKEPEVAQVAQADSPSAAPNKNDRIFLTAGYFRK